MWKPVDGVLSLVAVIAITASAFAEPPPRRLLSFHEGVSHCTGSPAGASVIKCW